MKRFFIFIFCYFTLLLNAYSQVVSFERTDVEGVRADFITATFTFGIDIRLDSIENCSNVAFELIHNKTNYIKYSEMKVSDDWGNPGVHHVVQPAVDTIADIARIIVEAGTGFPADSNSPNNPKVIHLEFVVCPNAIHGEVVDFHLEKVRATVFRDTIIELLIPITPKFSYKVHSYVDVWPGDADNNNIVDSRDFAVISKYLEEPKQKMRAFKRKPTSTLWKSQKAIAWDTLAATYCDCDGNGVVTNSDHLVVVYNMDSTWGVVAPPKVKKQFFEENTCFPNDSKILHLPVYIKQNQQNLIAVAASLNLQKIGINDKLKVLGIEKSNFFKENNIFYNINKDGSWVNFVIASKNRGLEENYYENPVCYIVVEKLTSQDIENTYDILVEDFYGISNFGVINKLEQKQVESSIAEEKQAGISISYDRHNLNVVSSDNMIQKIKIIDYSGQDIDEYYTHNYDKKLNINHLTKGIYFVIVILENKQTIIKKISL